MVTCPKTELIRALGDVVRLMAAGEYTDQEWNEALSCLDDRASEVLVTVPQLGASQTSLQDSGHLKLQQTMTA